MACIKLFGLEVVFATFFIAEAEKMLCQSVQPNRVQVEGAKRNVVVDDGLPLFGAQDFMYAIGRRGYLAVGLANRVSGSECIANLLSNRFLAGLLTHL